MGEILVKPIHNVFKKYRKVNLVNPYLFKNNKAQWRFDTIGDISTSTVFTIRRVSDNVEQTFTYGQITDGTYDAFISATFGAVKSWTNGTNTLSKTTAANQMYLASNSGKPYLYNPTGLTCIDTVSTIVSKFSNDWIVSIIHNQELNSNNQRCNLGISGDVLFQNFIMMAVAPTTNRTYLKLNSSTGSFVNSDLSVPISNTNKFDVYTFSKISGVLTIRKNNTILTQGAGSSTWTVGYSNATSLNSVRLGARDPNATGKDNKYQHIGHIADKDLSGFDLTGYINSLISRYGIT